MRQRWATLVLVLLLGLAMAPAGPLASAQDRVQPECPGCGPEAPAIDYVAGEVLVRFHPAVSRARAAEVISDEGAEHARGIPALGVKVLRLPPGLTVEKAVARFSRRPEVEYAEPNYLLQAAADQGMSAHQWAPQLIEADEAWITESGDPRVVIAIVDTGVDYNHTELAPNMWQNPGETPGNGADDDGNGKVDDVHGWDFVNNDGDPLDDMWHGTHVAGIVAADDNANPEGMVGICPDCSLMAVKVLNASGSGSLDQVANGMTYAADEGARVINLSLGATVGSATLANAVAYAWTQGAVVLAAAGNNGTDTLFYPAAYADAIAVASTDQNDRRSCFSNYYTGGSFVSVAAPGERIYSTKPQSSGQDTYGFGSGTSMATPHVSGLAGLLFAQDFDNRTNADVRALIESSTVDLTPAGTDPYFGTGRINAKHALAGTTPAPGQPLALRATNLTASAFGHARKLARDGNGRLHLAWHAQDGNAYLVLYATSDDDGVSWSGAQVLFSSTAETWQPALALDDDYVYVVFPSLHGASTFRTWFRRLDRSTGSWSDPVPLTETGYDAVRPDLYFDPTYGADGRLHMLASSYTNAPYVYYTSSTTQGATWDPVQQVNINDPDPEFDACVGDTRYATVYAFGDNVYLAGRTMAESCNWLYCTYLYCTQTARSTDGGQSWPDLYKEKLASWNATYTAEYGLSLAGVGDQPYLAYEVGSGAHPEGGLFFREWNGSAWSDPTWLETTGLWPTITQAGDGQAWMMWEADGSLKMRHYDGSAWEPAETILDATEAPKGYRPNLKLGTSGGRVEWVYTNCNGAPHSLAVGGRPAGVDAPPVVRIDAPTEEEVVRSVFTVQVHASDDNAVTSVALSIDGGDYQDITGGFDGTHYTYDWPTTGATDGGHTLQARATDNEAQTTYSTVRNVTVDNVNQAPVAAFGYHCTGLSCNFYDSGSYDPDGTIESYTWDFGDGNTATGETTSHTYGAAGTYSVVLTVTDNDGVTNTETQFVTVGGGGATVHIGDLDGTKISVKSTWTAAVTVAVHDASHGPVEGAMVSGGWSEGASGPGGCTTGADGRCTFDKTDIPKKVASALFTVSAVSMDGRTYLAEANHDEDGDSDGTRITVPPPANQSPVATFTYDECLDRTCTFDAAGSYDIDGSIVAYDWNFGDGGTGSGVTASHTYATDGTYSVVLTVTDDLLAQGTDSQSVTIGSSGGGGTMHVGGLVGEGVVARKDRWNATVTITIHDQDHQTLANATVTGLWSNGVTGTSECTTDASGQCSVAKTNLKISVGSAAFSVEGVTHAALTYNPAANHDPADSQVIISAPAP